MIANHRPTDAQLRLGTPAARSSLDRIIASSVGDPAYLHELGGRLDGWSRKQIEKAIGRLLDEGSITYYGPSNRRLYATARFVPARLRALSARAVRVLQYLPLEGWVELSTVEDHSSQAAVTVAELEAAGLANLNAGRRKSVGLTPEGAEVAATLGDGLRLPAMTTEDVRSAVGKTHGAVLMLLDGPASSGELRSAGCHPERMRDLRVVRPNRRGGWALTPEGRAKAVRLAKSLRQDTTPGGTTLGDRWHMSPLPVGRTREQQLERQERALEELSGLMTTPWTTAQVAEHLGITVARVMQIVREPRMTHIHVLPSFTYALYGGENVVDPGIPMTSGAALALGKMPGGWFASRRIDAGKTAIRELCRVGALETSTSGPTRYRLTHLGRWIASCLGYEIPDGEQVLERQQDTPNIAIRELALAIAAEVGAAGFGTALVNNAVGNCDLPDKLRIELTIANCVRQGQLERPSRTGRAWNYAITPEGEEWIARRGVRTSGAVELARWLETRPAYKRSTGLPPDAPAVTVVRDEGDEITAREHIGMRPRSPGKTGKERKAESEAKRRRTVERRKGGDTAPPTTPKTPAATKTPARAGKGGLLVAATTIATAAIGLALIRRR